MDLNTPMYDLSDKAGGPGDADWVKRSDPKGQAIIDVKCPQGTSGQLEVVSPND